MCSDGTVTNWLQQLTDAGIKGIYAGDQVL
ncbi:hypothetical protein FBZ96_11064 [Bradyrhizobium stylosanthis]|uniref:Uncharacterized protein n=1 Tax=Bradyrhizobium stylosanthis TaxID=1803665 RepID=A0A560D696_9BRAD|nr:hypothetical protein FBZ96_11064 [Bradyrhizobium stylosanthis]